MKAGGEALKLALAVAARSDAIRVYPKPPSNRTIEASWDGLTLPPTPYAVYVRGKEGRLKTLALDFDAGRGDPAQDVQAITQLFQEVGIRFIVCRSGSPGGLHIFATFHPWLTPGVVVELAKRLKALAPSLDTSPIQNRRTGAIRSPLAPHRSGGNSTLYQPESITEALSILSSPNPEPLVSDLLAKFTRPNRSHVNLGRLTLLDRPLSEKTRLLLQFGDQTGRYPSRSEAEMAIILGMVNAGWTKDRIRQAAEDPNNRGFPKFRQLLPRSKQQAERYLDQTISKALALANSNPPTASQITRELGLIIGAAMDWHPGGRTAATDRAVLFAHIQAAWMAQSPIHGLSQRQCAELAGIAHHATVARARRRLQIAGWLSRTNQGGNPSAADVFALMTPQVQGGENLNHSHPREGAEGGEKLNHSFLRGREGMVQDFLTPDLFRYGVLGFGPAEVYQYVFESGQEWSVSALANALGHDRKTIRSYLTRLEAIRLVLKTNAGWLASVRRPEEALLELPAEARLAGKRQQERHIVEREAWHERVCARTIRLKKNRTKLGGIPR